MLFCLESLSEYCGIGFIGRKSEEEDGDDATNSTLNF